MISFYRLSVIFAMVASSIATGYSNPSSKKTLRFEIAVGKESELAKGGMAILLDIFQKHGYLVVFEQLPLMRGLMDLKNGRLDGSAGRVAKTDILYGISGYERLDVPITYSTFSMWCHKSYATLVKTRPIKLGFVRGSVVADYLSQQVDKKTVQSIALNGYRSGALMLFNRRLDCLLGSERIFDDELAGEFDVSNFLNFQLVSHPYYTWISKDLVHLKRELELDLRNYPFPAKWMKKFRSKKSYRHNPLANIGPDGVVFTRLANLDDLLKK